MKTCRSCGTPDQTVAKRTGDYTLLCMECHIDVTRQVLASPEPLALDVRVWTPRETGVLTYNPFKPSLQGGGR
jgi:hypothetical protein